MSTTYSCPFLPGVMMFVYFFPPSAIKYQLYVQVVLEELDEKADVKVTWKGEGVFRVLSRTEPRVLAGCMRSLHTVCAYVHVGTIEVTQTSNYFKVLGSEIDWVRSQFKGLQALFLYDYYR